MEAVLREFHQAARQGTFPRHRKGRNYTQAEDLRLPVPLEPLGNGAFSAVYALDEKRVLKVAMAGHDPYHHFVQPGCRSTLVARGLRPECLPRIYAAKRCGPIGLYVLERLHNPEQTNPAEGVDKLLQSERDILNHYADEHGFMGDLSGNVLYRRLLDGRLQEVAADPWCDIPC